MAKITLPTIAAGYASNTAFNTAYDLIEAEFQNKVLYRNNTSGETNTMSQALDMNSQAINNCAMLTATGLTIGGVSLTAEVAAAAASATAAAASATAAASSATAAATSATASASSATSAAASYDSFDDRYLGSKSSAPTVDNDGNALITGALYWNTTSNVMSVRTAAAAWTIFVPSASELADIAALAPAAVIADMDLLGTSANVTAMGLLGVASVITDMGILGTADVVTDMNVLGTADVVTDMNVLGTSANVTAMGLLGTSTVVANIATVAANVAGVNSFADLYRGASSAAPTGTITTGTLYYDTDAPAQLYVWDGSAWQAAAFSVTGTVTAFNTRTGAVTLSSADVTGALSTGAIATAKIADDAITADKLADSINTEITANTAKVTNATHTGDVTGATSLTIASDAVVTAKILDLNVTEGKLANDAVTLAKMAGGTDGNLITYDTSGDPAYVPTGTAGQILTSAGAGAVPTFQTAASGDVSQVLHTKTVTGAVTATRAVSLAADGSVGVYPTINSLGSQINQTVAQSQVALGTGTTMMRTVYSVHSTTTNRASCYGSYLNGSGVWVENATPLVIDCEMISALSENAATQYLAPADPGTAGKYIVMQTSRSPTNQISAVQVNETTGAPTLFGSSLRRATSPGGSADGGQYRKDLHQFGFWENNVTYPYYYFNPSSGMQLVTADLSSALRAQFTATTPAIPLSRTSIESGGRLYWVEGTSLKNMACDATTHLVSGTATTVTIASDYLSDFKLEILDGTHFILYYKDTNSRYKFATYSFDSTSVTLIDTHFVPSDFTLLSDCDRKDTKNIVYVRGNTSNNNVTSVGLHTDWTILGTNVKQSFTNTSSSPNPRWTGSGDVYTLHLIDSTATSKRVPYTVNAYATTYFTLGGVASATASSGTTPTIVAGIASGYSGLTTGTDYHLDAAFDGTLTTDTSLDRVGMAVSTTEISLGDL